MFVIMKNEKFVKDFSDGKTLTASFDKAEKYISKKSAIIAAQAYGREYGKGYTVKEI